MIKSLGDTNEEKIRIIETAARILKNDIKLLSSEENYPSLDVIEYVAKVNISLLLLIDKHSKDISYYIMQ